MFDNKNYINLSELKIELENYFPIDNFDINFNYVTGIKTLYLNTKDSVKNQYTYSISVKNKIDKTEWVKLFLKDIDIQVDIKEFAKEIFENYKLDQ